ncbi:MAG TPA: methyltransferase, partial [Caulobacteraceae bacterium]|nr:methyltransferase [Caulobacteraceae bacterium]
MKVLHFDDPAFARRYAEGPSQFVPGYDVMQRMAAQLLSERAGRQAEILVLGAGGGLELEAFSRIQPGWRYVGVDPS